MSMSASYPLALSTEHENSLVGLRLLLVEDEFALAALLADTLEDTGAQVVGPVSSVESALALIDEVPEIDAAVLDVNLGSETVFPVADVLVRHDLPFVFATGCTREQLPPQYRGFDICTKPVEPKVLAAVLARKMQLPHAPGGRIPLVRTQPAASPPSLM